MSHRQLVVVFEATEEQGGSVVDALLQDGHYHVRGTTQDLASAEATRLAARGVEMVKAEANDVHILFDAFQVSGRDRWSAILLTKITRMRALSLPRPTSVP